MLGFPPTCPSDWFATLCAVALLTAACSEVPQGEVVAGEGSRFVPAVADFIDDVGLGNAVAVDADGVPYSPTGSSRPSSPKARSPPPVPSARPYIQTESTADKPGDFGAAVGVGSVSSDGIFTRGAAAQVRDTPTGITVPYGPATVDQLVGATSENTNGTDIAIDEQGGKHVVWTGPDGVWYASGADSFTAEQVFDYGSPSDKAGPIGRPAVTADADGNAWVAYTVRRHRPAGRGGDADRRRMGLPRRSRRRSPCATDAPAQATEIGSPAPGPPSRTWTPRRRRDGGRLDGTHVDEQRVGPGVSGDGLDMAVDADGVAHRRLLRRPGGVSSPPR